MRLSIAIIAAALILSGCESSSTPGAQDGWHSDRSPSGTEVRLHTGPDTFSSEVEVSLEAADSGAAMDPDAFEGETGTRPITHPAVARFSGTRIAEEGEQIDLWIEVPQDAIQQAEQDGRTIHGMIRLAGDDLPGPYPEALEHWHPALGPLIRSESGQVFLRLKLYATAPELYALAVSGPRYKFITDVDLSRSAKTRQPGGVFDVPWVIVCHGEFADPSVCDPDPDSGSQARQALVEATEAAAWLKQQGFDRARYLAVPHAEALRYAEDELGGTLVSDSAADPNDPEVHIARLVQQYPCGGERPASGCYLPSTGEVSWALSAVGSSLGDGTGLSNVYVHEMTHGIQAAMIEWVFYEEDPGDVRWTWLYEGTAETAAFWNLVPEPENLLGIRNAGLWHPFDLEHPLNHAEKEYPYLAVEFFLAADSGDPTYLYPFFERIENLGVHTSSYDAVDQAIEAELGSRPLDYLLALAAPAASPLLEESLQQELPLGLAFLNMMTERTPSQGFPHCTQPVFVAGLPEDPVVSEEVQAQTVPFSSACFDVEVLDYQTNFPGACLKVTLDTGDNPEDFDKLVFLVDGDLVHNWDNNPQSFAYAGDALWIQGGTGTVQLIDLGLERAVQAPPANQLGSNLRLEVDPDCGATEEEMASCFDTRVICDDDTCYLQMTPGDPPGCWVEIAMCAKDEGCYYLYGGEWVPGDFGVCGTTQTLMTSFQPPGEFITFEDAGVPAHGRCGEANFCRRIILCPKETP